MLASWRGPHHRRRRLLLVAVVLAVVVAVVAALAVHVVRESRRTPLDRALALLPAGSLRVGFTDWAAVRADLKPAKVTSSAGLAAFLDKAYGADLTAASSIESAAPALQENYGFSPATAEWEAYAQSRDGATMLLQMPDRTDMDALADRLDELGYDRPKQDTGVWRGGPDLISSIDGSLTPELQYVVLDAERHLVVTSDTAAYAAQAEKVVRGDAGSLADTDLGPLAATVEPTGAAFLWRGGFACEDLSMAQADGSARDEADRLVDAAGGVDALDGLVVALDTDRRMRVSLGFENDDQAKDNLRPRAELFVGPAPGREGSYSDDLTLSRSRTEGSAVVLDLKAKQSTTFPLTGMSQGPVLFATC